MGISKLIRRKELSYHGINFMVAGLKDTYCIKDDPNNIEKYLIGSSIENATTKHDRIDVHVNFKSGDWIKYKKAQDN
jgi:hypothetical protein